MKLIKTFELPVDNTILNIPHRDIIDFTRFSMKLVNLGIQSTDPLEVEENDIQQIVLIENKGINQKKWNKLIKYLLKKNIGFELKIDFSKY